MTPPVVYLAHPGASTRWEHLSGLGCARRWFDWVARRGYAVSANWIIYCEVWRDFDQKLREEGLRHDDALIAKCDEFWMVGGRISSGMARGRETALTYAIRVRDYTDWGDEPPVGLTLDPIAPAEDKARWCGAASRFICSRPPNHPADWHVAHDAQTEVHRWPVR